MMCYPFEFYRWPKLYLTHLNYISWLCRTVVGRLGNTEFFISNICSLKQNGNERLEMDFGTPTTGAGWSMTLFCLYYFFFSKYLRTHASAHRFWWNNFEFHCLYFAYNFWKKKIIFFCQFPKLFIPILLVLEDTTNWQN